MAKPYSKSRSKTTGHRNKSVEPPQVTEQQLQQDLMALVAHAEQAKSLTAIVTREKRRPPKERETGGTYERC